MHWTCVFFLEMFMFQSVECVNGILRLCLFVAEDKFVWIYLRILYVMTVCLLLPMCWNLSPVFGGIVVSYKLRRHHLLALPTCHAEQGLCNGTVSVHLSQQSAFSVWLMSTSLALSVCLSVCIPLCLCVCLGYWTTWWRVMYWTVNTHCLT